MTVKELQLALIDYDRNAEVRIGTAEGFIVPVWRVSGGASTDRRPLAVIEALASGDPDDDADNRGE